MFAPRRTPRFLFLTLTTALFFTAITVLAAPTSTQCTLKDLHKAVDDWYSGKAPLVEAYKTLGDLLEKFETIESRLSTQCDGVKNRKVNLEQFLRALEPATQIPPLRGLIKSVQQIGERLNIAVLKKPEQAICQTVIKIRNTIKNVVPKFKKIQDSKISKVILEFDRIHGEVGDALERYEGFGVNPTDCVPLGQLCAAAQEVLEFQRKLSNELKELIASSKPLQVFLEAVDNGVKQTIGVIDAIFDGDVGDVLDGVSDLLNEKIYLPIPRGAKDRGVGVIPNCCGSGYSMQGGLCYKTCRSGYDPVLFTCVEKCKPGWTDIGVVCARTVDTDLGLFKVPLPVFDTKDAYTRGVGRIPATFGNAACSCRRDKKYLEAGLCYNKCGRDQFSGYSTSFLTQCLDLRPTELTVLDLANHLNVFEKIRDIPIIGDVVKAVESVIDEVFSALSGPIADALKVPVPPLNFPINVPSTSYLDKIADVDFGIFDAVDRWAEALLRETSCRNA